MDGIVERGKRVDRVVDRLRQVIGQRADADALQRVQERPAAVLDRVGDALGHELDLDRQLLVC